MRRNKVYDEQELGTRIKIKKFYFFTWRQKWKERQEEKLKFTRKRAYYAKWIQQFVFLEFLICNSNTQNWKGVVRKWRSTSREVSDFPPEWLKKLFFWGDGGAKTLLPTSMNFIKDKIVPNFSNGRHLRTTLQKCENQLFSSINFLPAATFLSDSLAMILNYTKNYHNSHVLFTQLSETL